MNAAVDELRDSERAKYERVWLQPEYRHANHGLGLWLCDRDLFPSSFASALDIGCGDGRLWRTWYEAGIDAHAVDHALNAPDIWLARSERFSLRCLWEMRFDRRFDLGVCADVMEHIPPSKVDDVLARIAEACDFVVFKIANYPSSFGDGALHLTLHNADWWLAKLQQHGTAAEHPERARAGVAEYVFTLKVKR